MEAASAATATATMVFVYGTLKRGFPNHPRLAAFACPFAGAACTAAPASLVIGPYSVPFLLPTPTPSSGRLVSGELYSASPSALADLDLLEVPCLLSVQYTSPFQFSNLDFSLDSTAGHSPRRLRAPADHRRG